MNSHVSLLSNEGWNAYYAQRAMGLDSGPLYPPAGSMTFNNYPPASFYVVGALGWLVGDMVLAGRIIALLSLLSYSFMAGCIVRRLGGTPPAAGFTAWLLVFYAAVFDSDYIAVNDPQWLAQAIILSALLLLVPHRQAAFPGAGRILCAGLVTAVGLGFKHNILALPVAITLWLMVTDRRAALAWGTGLVMGGVVLGGMFAACFGPDFIHGVLGHRRTVYPGGLVKGAGNVLALGGLIVSAVLLPRLRLARGQGLLMGLYLFWAVVCAIGQRMGRGVSHNASFEALVAAVICAGLGVSYLATRSQAGSRFAPRSCVAFLVGINLSVAVGALPFYVPLLYRTTIGVRASIPAWNETIADIRQVDGNVACEILAACYWAGKPEMIDFFNYSQYVAVTHDASALQRAMDGHGIAAFVSGSRFRAFGPVWKFGTLWAVIRTRYTHVRPAGMAYIVTP